MDKLKMHTPSLADANFAALAALFPNAVTETIDENGAVVRAIDKDVLMQEISAQVVEGREERYQFTWPDKKKSVLLANAPIAAALRPCREESVNFDTTENLYIEGDNLDVLKLLRETYLGRVKMIYIDPPYNTGSDFVYEDDFSDSAESFLRRDGQYDDEGNRLIKNTNTSGRFHTDWLNMIYPRIRIAKDLLDKDGVIFISIDDNEVENLKKICDEVFGRVNFIACLVWEKKKKGSFLSNDITNIKEYLLVYAKKKVSFPGLIGEINAEEETYPCVNASNKREIRVIPAGITSKYRENDYFLKEGSVISDTTMTLVLHSDLVIKNGILAQELIIEGNWRYSQSAMTEYAEKQEIYITRDLYLRRIVKEARYKTLKDLLPRVGDNTATGAINLSNLFESGWGSNEDADEEQRLLFGEQKVMDYPKPVQLLYKIIASYRAQDFLALDFFSGSSTTAHAIIKLNADDGGTRRFIMVQIPEDLDKSLELATDDNTKKSLKATIAYLDSINKRHTVCEIGKERIRRAGAKIKADNPLATADLDVGFRVLKLDSSNMKDVYYTPDEFLTEAQRQQSLFGFTDNIKEDRSPEDLLFQVMLDLGIPLSAKIRQDGDVFYVNDNYLIACFKQVDMTMITEIAKKTPYYAVFRDGSFLSDSAMVNFEQVFNTYSPNTIRRVL
jgi:adenine-specific DNA-methyltransferase